VVNFALDFDGNERRKEKSIAEYILSCLKYGPATFTLIHPLTLTHSLSPSLRHPLKRQMERNLHGTAIPPL